MVLRLTEDKRFLEVIEATEIELEQLALTLRRRIKNWRFNPRVKSGVWDGYYSYFYQNKFVPAGLWKLVLETCQKYNYPIYFENLRELLDDTIDYAEFKEWVENFFDGFKIQGKQIEIREYQLDTAYRVLKYKKCAAELATSAGKTLINFIIIAYLLNVKKSKRILFIVPNVSLVIQAYNDFQEFNYKNQVKMNVQMLYSGKEEIEKSNIVIGTYQSLSRKKKEYFENFDVVAVDEAHKTKTYSIKNILEKCISAEYRFGMTGTFPKEGTLDRLTLMAYTGPLVNEVSAAFLQDKGYIAKCKISIIEMDYAPEKTKLAMKELFDDSYKRKDLYNIESRYVQSNNTRFNIITNIIGKSTKNSLVLFHHREYGKRIYEELRQKTTGKLIYYVDGNIDDDRREFYKKKMEQYDNIILVASYGTFSTGISIRNIHNIFFTESFKSEIIIRQSIGRGLRMHKSKDILNIVDFVDNFNIGSWSCYHMKHSTERKRIYNEQKFPYTIKRLKFAS